MSCIEQPIYFSGQSYPHLSPKLLRLLDDKLSSIFNLALGCDCGHLVIHCIFYTEASEGKREFFSAVTELCSRFLEYVSLDDLGRKWMHSPVPPPS